MPLRATLFAFLLCAAAARRAEIKTLKGESFKGEVVSVNSKEIVLDVAGESKTFQVSEIVGIDYNAGTKVPVDAKFTDVELVDGTLLHCTQFGLKGTTVTIKLLGVDRDIEMPLTAVSNVLRNAQDAALRKAWDQRIGVKRTHDAVAVNSEGILNAIDCTILEADAKGENISFKLKSGGNTLIKPINGFAGFIFQRTIDASAPPVVCKLLDAGRNHVMVAAVETMDGSLHVKTSAGVTLIYKPEQLVRLDYSSANLSYLSDLTPSKVVETSTEERIEHYRKDRNMDDRPIRLLGQTYAKGLALHSHTELEYKLKGEYRTLQAIAGIDDQVGGHNRPVVLKVYLDNPDDAKPNFTLTFSRKDPPKDKVKPIILNIKDVQVLRIVVTTADFLDLGLHLDLADARVIK